MNEELRRQVLEIYREVTRDVPTRGNLVPDAHLAALLRQHGVRTLYTSDLDFHKFGFLDVRDPFRCAAEIARVLKKGGQLYCCIPFLQPLHGYPHHYFNATPQGARRLFEDLLQIDTVSVPQALHPIWSLHWMVKSWSEGLDDRTREAFLQMPIKELTAPPLSLLERPPP